MQTKVLEFIRDYIEQHGYSPSIREIAAGVGLASSSAALYQVLRLEGAGLIVRDEGIARSIRLAAEEKDDE